MTNKKTIVKITTIFLLLFFTIGTLNTALSQNINNQHLAETIQKQSPLSDQEFNQSIRKLMLKAHIPSLSACIIKNNSIVWYNGFGLSSIYNFEKPNINTIYSVYSSTKPITATAIMQLYEQGKFKLDEDVNKYLNFNVRNPDYPDTPVTFRMLLAHQSSLARNSIVQTIQITHLFRTSREKIGYPYPMIKEILEPTGSLFSSRSWEDYEPLTQAKYSNLNFILLEHLIEVLSNQSYVEYCTENILEPLQMNNSSFTYEKVDKKQCAYAYENIGNLFYRIPFRDFPFGAGGLKTSINDLSHFFIAQMNNGVYKNVQILNKTTIEEMHRIQYPDSYYMGFLRFGLGWIHWNATDMDLKMQGHEGRYLGGTSTMMMNSTNKVGFMFFSNKMLHTSNIPELNAYIEIIYAFQEKLKEFI